MKGKTDVLIVGAGMVGLTAALLLNDAGFSVTLIDRAAPTTRFTSDFDLRTVALNPSAVAVLKKINAFALLPKSRIGLMHTMDVWERDSSGEIVFDDSAYEHEALSHIIENRELVNALWTRAKSQKNITIHAPFQIDNLSQLHDMADLIVGADGKNSWLRQALQIKNKVRDYHQHAVVGILHTEKPHNNTAYQVFLNDGPVGLLPLADPHTLSMVWSTTPHQAQALATMPDNEFSCAVSNAFNMRLGLTKAITQRVSIPLVMQHATTYLGERAVLIGDAAHSIHPLAGQGANLGIADALCLTHALTSAKNKRRPVNTKAALRPFERERRTKNKDMLDMMRVFKDVFSDDNKALSQIRRAALNTANKLQVLKTLFIHTAS
jgi:2-polyprenylphenol 6-hydroxylase